MARPHLRKPIRSALNAFALNPAVRGPRVARRAFECSNFQLLRRFTFRVRTASACSAGGRPQKTMVCPVCPGLPHRSLLKASLQLPDLAGVGSPPERYFGLENNLTAGSPAKSSWLWRNPPSASRLATASESRGSRGMTATATRAHCERSDDSPYT